jgi:hypothetical protein
MAMKKLILLALMVPLFSAGQDSLFTAELKPAYVNNETRPLELGVHFYSDIHGMITHVRFYKNGTDARSYQVRVYDAQKKMVVNQTYYAVASGWHRVRLDEPVFMKKEEIFAASIYSDRGSWGAIWNQLTVSKKGKYLGTINEAGRFLYGSGYPNEFSGGQNYLVDVVFRPFPADTVWMSETINIYEPKNGGWALTADSGKAYKAVFGFFPPPVNSVHELDITIDSIRYRIYSAGYWRKWRINADCSQTQIDTLHFKE